MQQLIKQIEERLSLIIPSMGANHGPERGRVLGHVTAIGQLVEELKADPGTDADQLGTRLAEKQKELDQAIADLAAKEQRIKDVLEQKADFANGIVHLQAEVDDLIKQNEEQAKQIADLQAKLTPAPETELHRTANDEPTSDHQPIQ